MTNAWLGTIAASCVAMTFQALTMPAKVIGNSHFENAVSSALFAVGVLGIAVATAGTLWLAANFLVTVLAARNRELRHFGVRALHQGTNLMALLIILGLMIRRRII